MLFTPEGGQKMKFFPSVIRFCAVAVSVAILSITSIDSVEAQQTTAEIRGVVYGSDGGYMPGAVIEIVHDASGARYTTVSKDSGNYQISGLRPGGPYTISIANTNVREENVYLNISSPGVVNLAEPGGVLEEVVVSGVRQITGLRMGASTLITNQQLNEAASIARDFKNVIRQDPRVILDPSNANAISIGGVNNRYNSLTVDGVRQNDEFGLNQSGFPTQRSPLSMDAIEQISIETAPFDVEYGGFQGGTVNIVTRSGTNDWHGSAYFFKTDDSMVGDKSEEREIDLGEYEEEYLGGTLSGPIIKDRLWFFFSYEEFTGSDPDATLFCPMGGGCANPIPGVTNEDVAMITKISKDVYGYDPLALFSGPTSITDEKWLAKVDWQVNDNHNVSVTYQFVEGVDLIDQGNSTFDRRLGLPSNFYNRGETMTAVSAQWFSRWTDSFSTEFKLAYKDIENLQDPLGGMEFAQMDVVLDNGSSIRFGPDEFRHANWLFTENWQFKAKADYAWGDHVSTFGYEYDWVDVFNIFAPTSLGKYVFSSVEDFENQRADSLVLANISITGDVDDLGGQFENTIHSFYIQDRWDVRDNLTLQGGLRLDYYKGGDDPFPNPNFTARHGFSNQETMDGRSVLMPRFGFNWQPYDRTTIRGGVGLFSGGLPSGFLSNSYSNIGILNMNGVFESDDMEDIVVDGYNIDPSLIATLAPGNGNVAAVDPDFDIPSAWKINAAWDQEFDIGDSEGYLFSLDLLLSWVNHAPVWIDGRREVFASAADGRPVYGALGCPGESDDPMAECRAIPNWDVIMTNTGKGTNHSVSASLSKYWDMGVYGDMSFRFAYTYMQSEAVSDALSSTPTSLLGREQTFDRNNSLLGRSSFETTHRVISNLTWRKTFFEHFPTTLSFFFQSQEGKPYGYTYDAPRTSNGDTFGGNEPIDDDDTQLLYVPTGPSDPKVIYASGFDYEGFDELINSESCLSKYRGKIAEKNSCSSPWNTRVDMRWIQEFRLPPVGKLLAEHSFEFILDIENLGNLINSEWGRYEQIGFPFTKQVVTLDQDLGPSGELIYNRFRDENFTIYNTQSLWKIQVGLRYRF